jgi:succinate dehydrogenase hydrophobic anchor subunit
MTFSKTNIVERMGALSLIIMGEGIIGMTESVSFMLKTSSKISSSTMGLVVAVVLVIYVLWMLYFDHTDKVDDAGARITKKEPWRQLWAFLHFPLHVAILLTLEGSAKLMLWWNANEALNFLSYHFGTYYPTVENGAQLLRVIQGQLGQIVEMYPFLEEEIHKADFQANLTQLGQLGAFNGTSDNDFNAFWTMDLMQANFFAAICEKLGIEYKQPLPGNSSTASDSQALDLAEMNVSAIFQVFYGWLVIFLVAAGCVLLLLALARYVGHYKMPIAKSVDGIGDHFEVAGKRPFAWVALALQCCIAALALDWHWSV